MNDLKNIFSCLIRIWFVIYYRKHHVYLIEIKRNMKFLNVDYENSRKLVVRFKKKKCLKQRIQRPWFQDQYFMKYSKLFFRWKVCHRVKFLSLRSIYRVFLLLSTSWKRKEKNKERIIKKRQIDNRKDSD